jgi:hypothetical protein
LPYSWRKATITFPVTKTAALANLSRAPRYRVGERYLHAPWFAAVARASLVARAAAANRDSAGALRHHIRTGRLFRDRRRRHHDDGAEDNRRSAQATRPGRADRRPAQPGLSHVPACHCEPAGRAPCRSR